MRTHESYGKVMVIDPNVFFAKRLARSLADRGYEVVHCTEPAYALTMIEWDMPVAILCSLHSPNSDGFEVPTILQSDSKTRHIPVIALGDCGTQSHLETLRAGYVDLVDRRLGADEMAAHLSSLIVSLRQGFQPTQMLEPAETRLDGHLSLMDLPSVMQMLEQSRQTGALHINSATSDGIIFFDSGEVVHAEIGDRTGNPAIIHLVKACHHNRNGTYKFVEGAVPARRTVKGTLTRLILDALCELDDEKQQARGEVGAAKLAESTEPLAAELIQFPSPEPAPAGAPIIERPAPEPTPGELRLAEAPGQPQAPQALLGELAPPEASGPSPTREAALEGLAPEDRPIRPPGGGASGSSPGRDDPHE